MVQQWEEYQRDDESRNRRKEKIPNFDRSRMLGMVMIRGEDLKKVFLEREVRNLPEERRTRWFGII
jgi:hypothetical protein